MEESVRNSLIIISAIIIGGIFVHGLWTIRKNKNPYKLKANPKHIDTNEPLKRDFDQSGFDQDGVSQVKVVGKNDLDAMKEDSTPQDAILQDTNPQENDIDAANKAFNEAKHEALAEDENTGETTTSVKNQQIEQTPENTVINKPLDDELEFNLDISVVEQPRLITEPHTDEKENEKENESLEKTSVYSDPVTKPKPKKTPRKTIRKPTKAELARDQMEINFGDTDSIELEDPYQTNATTQSSSQKATNTTNNTTSNSTIETEVLAISVVVPQGQIISGAALLPSLLTLGMKYGDMNIFHRHEDNAGNGKVTFSLANALNPGTFDLDNMENFVTQGVSLFMTLPNAANPFEVFDQMLVAAKQLALEFNGQLLDDKRSVLTKQTEQHYITKIREFERKSRLASL